MNTLENSEPKLFLESRCSGKEIGIRQVFLFIRNLTISESEEVESSK